MGSFRPDITNVVLESCCKKTLTLIGEKIDLNNLARQGVGLQCQPLLALNKLIGQVLQMPLKKLPLQQNMPSEEKLLLKLPSIQVNSAISGKESLIPLNKMILNSEGVL